jgi:hypothetical protein
MPSLCSPGGVWFGGDTLELSDVALLNNSLAVRSAETDRGGALFLMS